MPNPLAGLASALGFDSQTSPPTTPQPLPGRTRTVLPNQSVGYAPWWIDQPDVWDTATLGSVQLPGLVRVEATIARKIDTRSAPGSDGATVVDKGYEPAPVRITLVLWAPEHLNAWEAQVLPLINPRRDSSRRVALDIFHPALAELGIRRVSIKSVMALHPGSITGTMETTIECVEASPPTARGTVVQRPPAPTFGQSATAFLNGSPVGAAALALGQGIVSAFTTPGSPNAPPSPPAAPSTSTTP